MISLPVQVVLSDDVVIFIQNRQIFDANNACGAFDANRLEVDPPSLPSRSLKRFEWTLCPARESVPDQPSPISGIGSSGVRRDK